MRDRMSENNGCFQSPSFPYHVTKKRRALGTRMNRVIKQLFSRMRTRQTDLDFLVICEFISTFLSRSPFFFFFLLHYQIFWQLYRLFYMKLRLANFLGKGKI